MSTDQTAENKALRHAFAALAGWGALSIAIYLAFILVFPLAPHIYQPGRMLDMEIILRDGNRALIWVYIIGLCMLFIAYWRMIHNVHSLSKENPEQAKQLRKYILAIGLFCGVILLGLYPITALDVSVYVVNARNWVLYNANPLLVPPGAFPQDPLSKLAGEYVNSTSPYGPLWEALGRIPIQLGIRDIGMGILAMKGISLMAYTGMAWLIGWKAREEKTFSAATALTFFALNPLVLLEAVGNGHNDMTMLFFITLGLILWQRGKWAWAALALTLASLVKMPAMLIIPLFGLHVLMDTPNWKTRLLRGFGLAAITLGIFLISYQLMGPFPEVFSGILKSFTRVSFSPAYALFAVTSNIVPQLSEYILPNTRYVFLLFYAWAALQLLRRKWSLLEAGFAVTLAAVLLSNAFRIWYILWLLPFVALNLNTRDLWRIVIFSFTVELSMVSYFILWRWYLDDWTWGLTGPLGQYWNYFTIMTPLNVAWVFTLPFLPELIRRFQKTKRT